MVTVHVDAQAATATLKKIEEKLSPEMLRALTRTLLVLQGEIKQQVVAATAKGRPRGQLMNSFRPELLQNAGNEIVGRVGSGLPYAAIQEHGGEIRPKRAKFLTIPLPGTPFGARARDYANLRFLPGLRGSPVLAEIVGPNREIRPRFVLKRFVRLTGKGYLTAAAEIAGPKVEQMFLATLAGAVTEGTK